MSESVEQEPAPQSIIVSSEVQEVPKEETTMGSDEGGNSPVVEDNKLKDATESNGGDDAETNPSSSEASAEKEETPTSEEPPKPEPVIKTPSKPKSFVYDPNKITLRFIFANKDGVSVILECDPSDTVGEVKGALLSMWPDGKTCFMPSQNCGHILI